MEWTLEAVRQRLIEIKAKGFISIPEGMHRTDDGIVGQILEREFHIEENNLCVRDLGEFELKALRKSSKNLTLAHKTTESGLTPTDVFHRFGYIRASKRDADQMKKKLFDTVNGRKFNPRGLKLRSEDDATVDLYAGEEVLSRWNLTETIKKFDQIILVTADTEGKVNTKEERFHYTKAHLIRGFRGLQQLINEGVVVIEFCIDQYVDDFGVALARKPNGKPNTPHDRGPHIRIPRGKITKAYTEVIDLEI